MAPGEFDPEKFGGLVANVETLLAAQKTNAQYQHDSSHTIYAKIDNLGRDLGDKINSLSINGCAVGQQHSKDVLDMQLKIKKLEERPAKIVGIGVVILTGLGLIGGFLLWLHSRLGSVSAVIMNRIGVG